jgi:hypothetical protein
MLILEHTYVQEEEENIQICNAQGDKVLGTYSGGRAKVETDSCSSLSFVNSSLHSTTQPQHFLHSQMLIHKYGFQTSIKQTLTSTHEAKFHFGNSKHDGNVAQVVEHLPHRERL